MTSTRPRRKKAVCTSPNSVSFMKLHSSVPHGAHRTHGPAALATVRSAGPGPATTLKAAAASLLFRPRKLSSFACHCDSRGRFHLGPTSAPQLLHPSRRAGEVTELALPHLPWTYTEPRASPVPTN